MAEGCGMSAGGTTVQCCECMAEGCGMSAGGTTVQWGDRKRQLC